MMRMRTVTLSGGQPEASSRPIALMDNAQCSQTSSLGESRKGSFFKTCSRQVEIVMQLLTYGAASGDCFSDFRQAQILGNVSSLGATRARSSLIQLNSMCCAMA
eukprot:3088624-Amphidinium_carterae.1